MTRQNIMIILLAGIWLTLGFRLGVIYKLLYKPEPTILVIKTGG